MLPSHSFPVRFRAAGTTALVAAAAALAAITACSERSGGATGAVAPDARAAAGPLVAAYHGRLVDVYGVHPDNPGQLEPFRRDVLIGYALPTSPGDAASSYAIPGTDASTLQPRVVVQWPVGSPQFDAAFAALRAARVLLVGGRGGAGEADRVPCDAAFELEAASGTWQVGQEGQEAVQLFDRGEVAADQDGDAPARRLPVRLAASGRSLIVDPVLLGAEAVALSAAPTAALPQGHSLVLRRADGSALLDFRSGEPAPALRSLHLVGHLPFFLERVDPAGSGLQWVTLFKGGIAHEIDAGDGLIVTARGTVVPAVITEILAEPRADTGQPGVQHVQALVPQSAALEANDPSNLPGYPTNPQSPGGEAWLIANAPSAVLAAEFLGERRRDDGVVYGDDPRYFLPFDPLGPAAGPAGTPRAAPNENVSPFAGALLRFSAPVAMATARPFDTMFFATRDLLDQAAQQAFVASRGIDPGLFSVDKYYTPHLVAARLLDISGGQIALRLQPPLGFYLDDVMRQVDEGVPFENKQFRYFLHLRGGEDGVRGQGGEMLDLGFAVSSAEHLVLPFALDTSRSPSGRPAFPDNLAVSVVRRFATLDEDEQPSYYMSDEVQGPGGAFNPKAFALQDVVGAGIYTLAGRLSARPPTRVRQVVDNLNQQLPPQQTCPPQVLGEQQIAAATAAAAFPSPLLDPFNPYGVRLQAAWREIDMSLSRLDPGDFNLDVEQLFWGVFTGSSIAMDRFERVSMFLGTAEHRPEPCVGSFSALPTFPGSGLQTGFAANYMHNVELSGAVGSSPLPHPAFVDESWTIDPRRAVLDPTGTHRYLELPEFQRPYFVWRDERAVEQGGSTGAGSDLDKGIYPSYIYSPFLAGQGRYVTAAGGTPKFNFGTWNNQKEFRLAQPTVPDPFTDGSVGAIALPLLVDFQVHPSPTSSVLNGSQVSLPVLSAPTPNFRAFSSGGLVGGVPVLVDPSSPAWQTAQGGFTSTGQRTPPADNSVYWVMADFLKRTSVVTAGFVDLLNPHRMESSRFDPRLGPYARRGAAISFAHDAAKADQLQPGTSIALEFRGAGAVDPQPWRAVVEGLTEPPDEKNFPLDPLKAGDAHIRKFDDRLVNGAPRNAWTYYYNRQITDYTADLADLTDPEFTSRFAGPNEQFLPQDVRYVNWRMVMHSDPETAATPQVDSFWLAYRLE